jgi:hypothetical protein
MRILYIISSLHHAAGMERVTMNKVYYLSQLPNYTITILTLDQNHRPYFFTPPPNVKIVDLNINFSEYETKGIISKIISFIRKKKLLKKRLEEFLKENPQDIVISLVLKSSDFLYKINDGSKKIIEHHFSREYGTQFSSELNRGKFSTFIYKIREKYEYKHLQLVDKFVVLTQEDAQLWGKNFRNLCVIPNSITKTDITSTPILENKIVIAVGRLEPQKGFDILINIWKDIIPSHKGWELHIYGEGSKKQPLESQIKQNGLENSIKIFPPTHQIHKKIQNASIFTLTSRFEGLPMVLLESMSLGIPCIAFKCKCGPSDIINDNIDGFLIEEGNITEFSKKLAYLMDSKKERMRISKNALINIQRFSEEKVMQQWLNLFNDITKI